MTASPSQSLPWRAVRPSLRWGLAGLLLLLLAMCGGFFLPLEVVFTLALGWAQFLVRVVPQMQVSPGGAVSALVFLALFLGGLHLLARHLSRPAAMPWTARRTVALGLLVLVSFATGVCVVGVVHQSAWLVRDGRLTGGSRPNPALLMATLESYVTRFAWECFSAGPVPWTQATAWLAGGPDDYATERLEWLVFPDSAGLVARIVAFPRDPAAFEEYGGWQCSGAEVHRLPADSLAAVLASARALDGD